MVVTAHGLHGVCAARLAGAARGGGSGAASAQSPPVAGKRASHRDWDLASRPNPALTEVALVSFKCVPLA